MAIISRPQKTGGNRTYAAEAGAGYLDIIDQELDEDFRTVYDEFNGGITDANIAAGAAIDYSKLELTGRIVIGDLDPAFGTGLSSIPNTSFVPGASLWDHGHQVRNDDLGVNISTADAPSYLSVATVKARLGSLLLLRLYVSGTATVGGSLIGINVVARVKRDGAFLLDAKGWATHSQGTVIDLPWTIYYEQGLPIVDEADHTYTVDVLTTTPQVALVRAGSMSLMAYA